ncbi:hypothetical protein [Novosphingobium mangrovi (ex Huang et al. 2023)]|uniref:Uncharacterized protein n=1 Tax=Novosphingobium mangrovi (ex Huang et al. 2023) TaxID=2976432 RepID=A0ABT2I6U6_9SPHN|nr:hypothetical protein [Novosphingobium mangrovi (ex Huang et al. 2023)]MCT2400544.1 hypothetical protein [Novosphingobium mangrovi (ex Huang et al. 2023)]
MYRIMLAAVLALGAAPVLAEPTGIVVRVIAQDAKFVGSSMGGVRIVLRDTKSGTVLAEGRTEGGTGNTARIMKSNGRSPLRADGSEAAFSATLDISKPTLVELDAYGPLDYPESAVHVSQQRWVMPGENAMIGDGWTVELPGLVINPETRVDGRLVRISAKVMPMCGCPIEPDGLWPADEYEVSATVWKEGLQLAKSKLAFDTSPGVFSGDVKLPAKGHYELTLSARNKRTGNSGIRTIEVTTE